MRLYRADKRDFQIGDTIVTAGEFTSKNPDGSNTIEEIFESHRPTEKPERSTCLYLFEDLTVAKKHWSKMSDGKLYEVEVDEEIMLHKADMQLVDKAFLSTEIDEKTELAKSYWLGRLTENPKIEILVDQATVTKIISKDQNERRQFFKSWALA